MPALLVYRRGDRGRVVADIQRAVGVTADGIYGPNTEAAVRAFQANQGLVVDGIAGPKTLTAAGVHPVAGVDVSGWNSPLDWHQAYAGGIRFAFVKATEGQTFISKVCRGHVLGAQSAGVKAGVYHFATASDSIKDAEAEAKHCHAVASAIGKMDLPPVLDIESDPARLSTAKLTEWCEAWCATSAALWGRAPIVYTYKAFLGEFAAGSPLFQRPLWIARLTSANDPGTVSPWPTWAIWQHHISSSVPGATGKTDLNWLAGGPQALEALCKS